MTEQSTKEIRDGAKDQVLLVLFFGLFLSLIGGIGMVTEAPHIEVSALGNITQEGSQTQFLTSILCASSGAILLSLVTVAFGVMLGMRLARD